MFSVFDSLVSMWRGRAGISVRSSDEPDAVTGTLEPGMEVFWDDTPVRGARVGRGGSGTGADSGGVAGEGRYPHAYRSLPLSEVPSAGEPRALIFDQVLGVSIGSSAGSAVRVHVRAWVGTDGYTVVLFAEVGPEGVRASGGLFDTMREKVRELLPSAEPSRTAIVQLLHGSATFPMAYEVHDATAFIVRDPDWWRRDSTAVVRPERCEMPDLEMLTDRLGVQPTLYHRGFYTHEAIEAYQRTGEIVVCQWDPDLHEQFEAWWEHVEGREGEAFDLLRTMVLDEIYLLTYHSPSRGGSSRDAVEPDELMYPWTPQATTLVYRHARPDLLEQANEHRSQHPQGVRLSVEEARRAWEVLSDLSAQVTAMGSDPDPVLAAMVAWARNGIRLRTDWTDIFEAGEVLTALDRDHPLEPIRVRILPFARSDAFMVRYLQRFVPQPGAAGEFSLPLGPSTTPPGEPLASHEVAHLLTLTRYCPLKPRGTSYLLGRDAFGRPAALAQAQERGLVYVLEDYRSITQIDEATDFVVSDAHERDDSAMFIERGDRLVGMVPTCRGAEHAFGYGGAGPRQAAKALSIALIRGGIDEKRINTDAIRDLVQDSRLRDPGEILHAPISSLLTPQAP